MSLSNEGGLFVAGTAIQILVHHGWSPRNTPHVAKQIEGAHFNSKTTSLLGNSSAWWYHIITRSIGKKAKIANQK